MYIRLFIGVFKTQPTLVQTQRHGVQPAARALRLTRSRAEENKNVARVPPAKSGVNTAPGVHTELIRVLTSRLNSGASILDIPSGSGLLAQKLLARGLAVQAADILPQRPIAGVPIHVADMDRPLPFADGSFDSVVSAEGIEHLERPFDFVREVRRILRPGGLFVLSTPNISALRSRWRYFLTGFHNKGKVPLDERERSLLDHIGLTSFPELRYMLHTSGYRIDQISTNRIKLVSWLYAPWLLVSSLVTPVSFAREDRTPEKAGLDADVARQLRSRAVAFGELLVLAATKT